MASSTSDSRPYVKLERWKNLQKVYASEQPRTSFPEDSFNKGKGSSPGPSARYRTEQLPILEGALERARQLCLAQCALAVAALWTLPVAGGWLRWAVLLGATLGVAYLTHLQQHSLRYEAIADQLRRHPPAFLKVNTAQPPLMQALDVLSELRSHGATDGGLCTPQLLVKVDAVQTRGKRATVNGMRRGGDALAALTGIEVTEPLQFAWLKIRQAVTNLSDLRSGESWHQTHHGVERRGSFGSNDEEIREFITSNFSIDVEHHDDEALTKNIGLLTRRFSLKPGEAAPEAVAVVKDAPLDSKSHQRVEAMLEKSREWEFNALDLIELTNNHSLLFLGYWLFVKERLPEMFNIPHATLLNFLTQLEASYRDVPYHNRNHAADVLQGSVYMLNALREVAKDQIRPLDTLALIVAAAAHDMDHTGQNNAFHVVTGSELALRYNDKSVLESHHCYRLFSMLNNQQANIFAGLSTEQRRELREITMAMILGTDMAFHFKKVDRFNTMRAAGDLDCSQPETRTFVLEMLLHCADTANPTRPEPIYRQWAARVMEEFYQQGDLERASNLPVTKFFDRATTNVPKCQIGFINIIVSPLVEAFADFLQLPTLTDCLHHNRDVMEAEAEAGSFTSRPPQPAGTAPPSAD